MKISIKFFASSSRYHLSGRTGKLRIDIPLCLCFPVALQFELQNMLQIYMFAALLRTLAISWQKNLIQPTSVHSRAYSFLLTNYNVYYIGRNTCIISCVILTVNRIWKFLKIYLIRQVGLLNFLLDSKILHCYTD